MKNINIYFKNIKSRLLNSSIAKDSFWALVGSVLGKGLSLIAGIVVARFLGKEVYGEFGMVKTTLIQIAMLSTFGLGYTITKYVAQYKKERPNDIRQIVHFSVKLTAIISGIIALLVFIFSKQLAIIIDAPHLHNMLRLTSIAIIFNAITTTQIGALAGFNSFKTIAKNNFYAGVVTFLLSVLLTYYFGLNGAVVALVISLIYNCIINYYSLRKNLLEFPIKKLNDKKISKEIFNFSLPVALQESSYSIIHWALTFVLIKLSNYGELGVYNAAAQWGALIAFLPGVLRNVMLSHFSESSNDVKRHVKIVNKMLLVNIFFTLIPFLFVVIFSDFIVSFYGSTFTGMNHVLNVIVFSSIITAVTSVFNQEFMSKGKNWFLFLSRFIRDILLILLVVLSIKFFEEIRASLILSYVSLILKFIYCMLLLILFYKRK